MSGKALTVSQFATDNMHYFLSNITITVNIKLTDCIFANKMITPSGVLFEVNSTQTKNSLPLILGQSCKLFYSSPYTSIVLPGGRQWNNPHCSNSPAVSVYISEFNALQLLLDSVITKFTDGVENGFL